MYLEQLITKSNQVRGMRVWTTLLTRILRCREKRGVEHELVIYTKDVGLTLYGLLAVSDL